MKRTTEDFLQDILESIEHLEEYTGDLRRAEFMSSRLTQDAVFRKLGIISEAVKHIPIELRKKHPSISWEELSEMRNNLVDEHSNVDLPTVWTIVREDTPKLKRQITDLLDK